jgi:hypothetical protein
VFEPIRTDSRYTVLSDHDKLWNEQLGLCFYCEQPMEHKRHRPHDGRPVPLNSSTIEHLKMKSRGGKNEWGNKKLACYDCNTHRGNVPWQEYRKRKAPKKVNIVNSNANPLADINNLLFVDTETRSEREATGPEGNLKQAGTYRYVKNAFVIISTWAIGDEPVWDWSLHDGFDGDFLCWDDAPYKLKEFFKRVEQREAWLAAFNAGFDRNAINNGTYGFPKIEPDMMIDVMAQAVASNLPPNLEGSSRAITGRGKQDDGKLLINLFCGPLGPQPWQKPAEWKRFVEYGIRDTDEMRAVWKATRPLPFDEWEDYWVSEYVNARGVAVDIEFAKRAAALADAEAKRLAKDLARWTNGQITAVTQTARIADWLYDNIPHAEAREQLVKEWIEDANLDGEDDTADMKVGKLSIAKSQLEGVAAYYATKEKEEGGLTERDQLIYDVVQARQFGGSTSPFKFEKILLQEDEGRLRGQYVFNGAAQTGRFSSKGVQTHNLTRSALKPHEEECIEFINSIEL